MGIDQGERVAVVVEDDDDIRHLLETVLSQAGFQVIAAANGLDGIEAVRRYNPVVTTLDVNLPGIDGFEVARRIRAISPTYIVMLTALSEEIDTLQGLEAGADDFVKKPFRPRELRARIEALLRRPRHVLGQVDESTLPYAVIRQAVQDTLGEQQAAQQSPFAPQQPAQPVQQPYVPQHQPYVEPAAAAPAEAPGAQAAPAPAAPPPPVMTTPPIYLDTTVLPSGPPMAGPPPAAFTPPIRSVEQPVGEGWITHNGLSLNSETRVVQADGSDIELTRSEFDLLESLLVSNRRVRTKADLVLVLRNESYVTSHFISEADKRAIEVHMANLRKKLQDNVATPRWIETVRGVGYRTTASDS